MYKSYKTGYPYYTDMADMADMASLSAEIQDLLIKAERAIEVANTSLTSDEVQYFVPMQCACQHDRCYDCNPIAAECDTAEVFFYFLDCHPLLFSKQHFI